uniref:FBA_2 domain-containing protein n=1 Tax=Caenorhabditis tropicalis TaxID=1561998 RepID=A0A1I7UVL8_9PELO
MTLNRASFVVLQFLDENVVKRLFYGVDGIDELSELEDTKKHWVIGDVNVPITKDNGREFETYKTYWNNPYIGLRALVSYFTDLFNIPIHFLHFGPFYKNSTNDSRRAVDWVMSRQCSVNSFMIHGHHVDDEIVHYTLNNCQFTEYNTPTSPTFRRSLKYHLKSVEIYNAPWITVENLIELDCCELSITESRLTSEDINRFLRNWARGGSPRLRSLFMGTMTKLEKLTDGLYVKEVSREEKKEYFTWVSLFFSFFTTLYYRNSERQQTIKDSWDIKRDDLRVASIVKNDGISTFFTMVVWPDFYGNLSV